MKSQQVQAINLRYSQKQIELFFPEDHYPKYNVVPKGRRGGLTKGAANAFIEYGLSEDLWFLPPGEIMILWIDVTQANLQKYYERYFYPELMKLDSSLWNYRQQEKILKVGRATIDFKSAEIPANIEGGGYHIIFVNEAGHVLRDDYLYTNTILPMLIDFPNSKFIAAGTPRGRIGKEGIHKFYEMYLKAQEDKERYRIVKFTGFDNPFISREELEEALGQFDDVNRQQEIYGEFVHVTDKKFLYAFNEDKHVIPDFKPNPHLPIICSFDFNKDPMTCLIGQQVDIHTCYAFDDIEISNGSTPEICEVIKGKYSRWFNNNLIDITGDSTGRNRSALTRGNLNHYRIIKDELCMDDRNLLVRRSNMALKDSRILCNSVLQNAKLFITEQCRRTINDMHAASVDDEGDLIKSQTIGLHHFDTFRYLIGAVYPDFIRHPDLYDE